MVAKSYQSLEVVGDVYTSKGRQYIQVRTKSGTIKAVRWYTEKEYAKMYPDEEPKMKETKSQKEVLGFTNGYITIFKGDTFNNQDYFRMSSARYARTWGWYFISTEPIPEDIPEGVEAVRLPWDIIGKEDGTLKSDTEIAAAVESLLYDPDASEYQGEIGEKLELVLTVEKAFALDGYYGPQTLHTMRDYDGNCYVWITAAKSWEVGTEHHICGTVKDHKQYKGVRQTVLTRCRSLDR